MGPGCERELVRVGVVSSAALAVVGEGRRSGVRRSGVAAFVAPCVGRVSVVATALSRKDAVVVVLIRLDATVNAANAASNVVVTASTRVTRPDEACD